MFLTISHILYMIYFLCQGDLWFWNPIQMRFISENALIKYPTLGFED